jgi:hypothetical protein
MGTVHLFAVWCLEFVVCGLAATSAYPTAVFVAPLAGETGTAGVFFLRWPDIVGDVDFTGNAGNAGPRHDFLT